MQAIPTTLKEKVLNHRIGGLNCCKQREVISYGVRIMINNDFVITKGI